MNFKFGFKKIFFSLILCFFASVIFAEENTKYIITFCNDDGTILQQDTLNFGEMPEYRGEIPTKESEYAKYSFAGWSPELRPATENIIYTAIYKVDTSIENITTDTRRIWLFCFGIK